MREIAKCQSEAGTERAVQRAKCSAFKDTIAVEKPIAQKLFEKTQKTFLARKSKVFRLPEVANPEAVGRLVANRERKKALEATSKA
jgi:hypothetical protein